MSSSDSDLSDPRYGYDFVVATTQASINATLKEFLADIAEPVTTACYVADGGGNPVPIDYTQLKQQAGADPFAIPADVDAGTDADIQKTNFGAVYVRLPGSAGPAADVIGAEDPGHRRPRDRHSDRGIQAVVRGIHHRQSRARRRIHSGTDMDPLRPTKGRSVDIQYDGRLAAIHRGQQ